MMCKQTILLLIVALAGCGGPEGKDDEVVKIDPANMQTGNNVIPDANDPQFDPQTCITNIGGTLVSCYDGEGIAEGITFHFAEVPQLDEFGQTYLHRYFYTEDSFGARLCGDAAGVSPGLAAQIGIPGEAECSVTRVWDQSQAGYQTFDAAFCVRPNRTEASFVVEPFQSPPYRVIYGPFTNTCRECVPDVNAFCAGAL